MYPVYRPSQDKIVWVNSLDNLIFITKAETLLAKIESKVSLQDHYESLSLLDRILYKFDRK